MLATRAALNEIKPSQSTVRTLFAPSEEKIHVPTLRVLASIEWINQLGSVEKVEAEIIKSEFNEDLFGDTQIILAKIKKLYQYNEETR